MHHAASTAALKAKHGWIHSCSITLYSLVVDIKHCVRMSGLRNNSIESTAWFQGRRNKDRILISRLLFNSTSSSTEEPTVGNCCKVMNFVTSFYYHSAACDSNKSIHQFKSFLHNCIKETTPHWAISFTRFNRCRILGLRMLPKSSKLDFSLNGRGIIPIAIMIS